MFVRVRFCQAGPEGERMLASDHKDRRMWNCGHKTWFQQRQRALQAGWRCAAHVIKYPHTLKVPWHGWFLKSGWPWQRGPVNKKNCVVQDCDWWGEKRRLAPHFGKRICVHEAWGEGERAEYVQWCESVSTGAKIDKMFVIAPVQSSDVTSVCSCTLDTRITSTAWSDRTLKW